MLWAFGYSSPWYGICTTDKTKYVQSMCQIDYVAYPHADIVINNKCESQYYRHNLNYNLHVY